MPSSLLITPSSTLACSLAEYKLHLRMEATFTGEDNDLTIKLWAAQQDIAERTGRRSLIEATWERRLSEWPSGDEIDLDVPQVSSITSLKYTPAGSAEQTVTAADYKLVGGYDKTNSAAQACGLGKVVPAYGKSWPSAGLDSGEPIAVRYVAGWKDAASVPYAMKAAILLQAENLYRNRSAVIVGTNSQSHPLADGVERLIAPFSIWSF